MECYVQKLSQTFKELKNKGMQLIKNMQWSTSIDPSFNKHKMLKLEDLVKLETSKLMFNFDRYK